MSNQPLKNIHLLTKEQYAALTPDQKDLYAVQMPSIEVSTTIDQTSTNNQLPSSKAVYDLIIGAIEGVY